MAIGIDIWIKHYGYEIGYSVKQKILKNKFNNNHTTCVCNNENDCYQLEKIINKLIKISYHLFKNSSNWLSVLSCMSGCLFRNSIKYFG